MNCTSTDQTKPRIAVIGSGLAGLSSAYFLSTIRGSPFTVHLYEKSSSLGMDSGSIEVPCPCVNCNNTDRNSEHFQDPKRVDVPMRSFFPTYYPNLQKLYDQVKIPYTHLTDNSMSFCIYKNAKVNPASIYKLSENFPSNIQTDLKTANNSYDVEYPDLYFTFSCYTLPYFKTVYSLPDLPKFVAICFPFGKMSFVTSSVNHVVSELSKPIDKVFLNTQVTNFKPLNDTTSKCRCIIETNSSSPIEYSHIIFATQANQAAKILRTSASEKSTHLEKTLKLLDSFPYDRSLVVCHMDEKVLPDKENWRCLNFSKVASKKPEMKFYRRPNETENNLNPKFSYKYKNLSQCTHIINFVDKNLDGPKSITGKIFIKFIFIWIFVLGTPDPNSYYVLQTTNPIVVPDVRKTIGVTWYERCIVTMDSVDVVGKFWYGNYFYQKIYLVVKGELKEMEVASTIQILVKRLMEILCKEKREDGLLAVTAGQVIQKSTFGGKIFEFCLKIGIPLLEGCVSSSIKVVESLCLQEGIEFKLPWNKELTKSIDETKKKK
ncbi:hypothetical protein HK099_004539 [Clydaea vesicula]|uniref:Uncharacterized protein n=1 Tax=Clydaea vesicula TaxID=447962 RepID=A0AAD5U0N0_9FUNG|nr:hypothetical protein HK099_004539 [Clydaea vesicula]